MSTRDDRNQDGEPAGQQGSEPAGAPGGVPEHADAASDITQRSEADEPPAGGDGQIRGVAQASEDAESQQDDVDVESSRAKPADGAAKSPSPGSRRARREARGDVPSQRVNALPFLLAGALVVLFAAGMIWWFVIREAPPEETVTEERDEDPGVDGVIQRGAEPDQWLIGDCLNGFESEHAPATIVECDRSYDRQVLQWDDLDDGAYPGDDQISEQAVRVCEEHGHLDQDQVDAVDYELEVELSHPSQDTWTGQDSDRRVNCLLRRVDGQQLSGNFVLDPETDSSAEDFEEDEQAESEGQEEDSGDTEGEGDDNGDDAEPDNDRVEDGESADE